MRARPSGSTRQPRTHKGPGTWLTVSEHRGKWLWSHFNQLLSMLHQTPVSLCRQPRASPGTWEVLKVGTSSSFSLSSRDRVMALGSGQGCDHRVGQKGESLCWFSGGCLALGSSSMRPSHLLRSPSHTERPNAGALVSKPGRPPCPVLLPRAQTAE